MPQQLRDTTMAPDTRRLLRVRFDSGEKSGEDSGEHRGEYGREKSRAKPNGAKNKSKRTSKQKGGVAEAQQLIEDLLGRNVETRLRFIHEQAEQVGQAGLDI